MLIPSSSPITFREPDDVTKHLGGKHDQNFHAGGGLSAAYKALEIKRRKIIDQGKADGLEGLKPNSRGQIIVPEATGGYKAGIPDVIMVDLGGDKPDKLTPKDSMWHHMESDGEGGYRLTAERAALHRSIVEQTVAGVPVSENPTFFMLGGGPAAGKSSALKSGIALGVPDPKGKQTVAINADDIKSDLPEYERLRNSNDNREFFNAAGFAHEESSYIAKKVQVAAISNNQDIILDGTGDSSPTKLQKKINEAADGGYQVRGVYFTVPTDMAWDRATARSLQSGERRFVPEKVVRETHRDVSRTFAAAADSGLFSGGLMLIDSSNDRPARLVGESKGSGPFVVADETLYSEFLAKGDE